MSGKVRDPDLGSLPRCPHSQYIRGPSGAGAFNRIDDYGGNGCWILGSYRVFKKFIDKNRLMGLYWF